MENLKQNKAPVWRISRHRLNTDGLGVTTLVAFDGCHLDCAYCINSETKFKSGLHHNKEITPQELYDIVKKDDLYFVHTHGGITFGGGEPLVRHEFIRDFAKLCKNHEWRLRIETSLNVPIEAVQHVSEYIEHWYIDIKDVNPNIYKHYTGISNNLVLGNLKWLADNGNANKVTIRVPHISEYNKPSDVNKSIEFLQSMGFTSIEELEYLTPEKQAERKTHKNQLRGKSVCMRLKQVRCKIAERYEIAYQPHECTFQGYCIGTCPRCELEVDMLDKEIRRKNRKPHL